ncbi:MAG TPA: anaerobic sulfatase maturase [Ruminococcaceae bacterium]|nr:anaerobic sulfatase maturase [Oscillospiraceae bacterium]HCO37542.1 anaerobic sulfatase maturase [Oscillospiraceae bacterium]
MAVSVMLKPSSSACNLKCKYCFYSNVSSERAEFFKGMMSDETAENVISKALSFADSSQVYFTFQGGEPLLRGVDFFKRFVSKVKALNIKNSAVTLCVQTNGTLIDDEWCRFFKDNNVLVGVSLDGDEELNSYRVYPDGKNSFDDIMRGISLLDKYGINYNILSVLTSRLAQNVRRSYRFFKQHGFRYLQYIPCLKPFDCDDDEYAMSVDDYASYLKSCYKIYFNDNMRGNLVSIRQFDNYALLASGKNAEQCGMNGPCSTQFVVEGDGSVYPCDFYCTDEWLLGNINENDFNELFNSKLSVTFLKDSFKIGDDCKKCDYFTLCRGGGCKRNRQNADYCKAYKDFFASSYNMILQMSR